MYLIAQRAHQVLELPMSAFIFFYPLSSFYDGASHVLYLISWSATWLFIISGDYHMLRGSVL